MDADAKHFCFFMYRNMAHVLNCLDAFMKLSESSFLYPFILTSVAACGYLSVFVCFCVGQGPEDSGQLTARPGVFRQGQVVQHPGSWLELANSPPGRRPARSPARPPGLIPRLLRFLWRGWLPKLHETVQLVDGEGRAINSLKVNPFIGGKII